MLEQLLIRLGKLAIGSLITFGPLAVLIMLLNLRDRRESYLSFVVYKQLNSPDLRGLITFKTRCALFSRHSMVKVDMRGCSNEQIWDAIKRLSHSLPLYVRLIVHSTSEGQFESKFTIVRSLLSSVDKVSTPPADVKSPYSERFHHSPWALIESLNFLR